MACALWTPTITDSTAVAATTYSVQKGDFSQNGNFVFCNFLLSFSGIAIKASAPSMESMLVIAGLPIPIVSAGPTVALGGSGLCAGSDLNLVGQGFLIALAAIPGASSFLMISPGGGGQQQPINPTMIADGSVTLQGALAYFSS